MSLLTAGILVLMRYYAPDLLHDVHAPTKEQWAYAIIVGVVFTAADVLLIMAARLGSIPGAIPMLAALTLVFTVVLDNIFNNTAIPLKTHYAIGIGIIVLAIFVIAGGDYLESLKK